MPEGNLHVVLKEELYLVVMERKGKVVFIENQVGRVIVQQRTKTDKPDEASLIVIEVFFPLQDCTPTHSNHIPHWLTQSLPKSLAYNVLGKCI